MRWLKPILLIAFSLLFGNSLLSDIAVSQEESFVSQITDSCYSFELTDSFINCGEAEVLEAIIKSCEALKLNLFRIDTCYSSEGTTIDIYCSFNNETKALDALKVSRKTKKRFLDSKDTVLSSDRTKASDNSSLIIKYPTNTNVTYYSLSAEQYANPIDGVYYIEGSYDNCMQIGKEIHTILTRNYPALEEIQVNEIRNEGAKHSSNQEKYILPLLIYVVLVLSLLVDHRKSRQIAVVCLTGGLNVRMAQKISFGKLFYGSILLSTIVIVAAVIWYGDTSKAFFYVFISVLPMLLIYLLGYLYIHCFYAQSYSRLIASGKMNYYVGWFFLLITKVIMSLFLFSAMLNTYVYMNNALDELPTSSVWDEIAEEYAVCPKLIVGMDEAQIGKQINRNDISMNAELYPILNQRGAIYCALDFHEYEYPIAIVNPNYLARFPIYDTVGEQIVISEDETNMILLSPYVESYDQVLLEMMTNWRMGLWELENMYNVEPLTESMAIKIIHIAPYQNVFTLQPGQEYISNSPIRVITEKNSLMSERVGIQGGGLKDPLKIKLLNGSPGETYSDIAANLRNLRLDDNITSLVTVGDSLVGMKETLHNTIVASVLTFIQMIILQSFFDVVIVFIRMRDSTEEICIQLVNGVSITARYSSYFILILIHLCLVLITGCLFKAPVPFILISCSLVLVQFCFALILVYLIENKYIATYLKGGLL